MGGEKSGCMESKHSYQEWEGRVCGEKCVPEWDTTFIIFIILLGIWVPYSSGCHQFPATLLAFPTYVPTWEQMALLLLYCAFVDMGQRCGKANPSTFFASAQSLISDPSVLRACCRATPSFCRRCLLCVSLSNQIPLFSSFLGFPFMFTKDTSWSFQLINWIYKKYLFFNVKRPEVGNRGCRKSEILNQSSSISIL